MRKIGITTTVPIELIFSSNSIPIDLNNRFINHPQREKILQDAEAIGFPANICSWVKGISQMPKELGIKEIVGVVRGDCSSTEKLLELFKLQGLKCISFSYPFFPQEKALKKELKQFARELGTSLKRGEEIRKKLKPIRKKLSILDELTWRENLVSGAENHLYLVNASDFLSEPDRYGQELTKFIESVRRRKPFKEKVRLAYLGVPPIFDDIYNYLEQLSARVVYNEVQREFAMIKPAKSLTEQYLKYTYPYDIFYRLNEIKRQIKKRKIAGIIHYAQTFCHRQIESIIIKKELKLPVLTIEGDKPGAIDERTKTRIQAFLEMLISR